MLANGIFFSTSMFSILSTLFPDNKILSLPRLIGYVDAYSICLSLCRKHYGKRRNCWFSAFSHFQIMFSEGFVLKGVKSGHRVVKSFKDKLHYLKHI